MILHYTSVSYTHLDVYKRQALYIAMPSIVEIKLNEEGIMRRSEGVGGDAFYYIIRIKYNHNKKGFIYLNSYFSLPLVCRPQCTVVENITINYVNLHTVYLFHNKYILYNLLSDSNRLKELSF